MGLLEPPPPFHQRRAPPRSTNSSPFLRKPIPRGEESTDGAAAVAAVPPAPLLVTGSSAGTTTPPTKPPRRRLSYTSLTQLVTNNAGILGSSDNNNIIFDTLDNNHDPQDDSLTASIHKRAQKREKFTSSRLTVGVGTSQLERHLSLFDLIAIGVGGTIGSGLFVLAGLVAHEYAGPATIISWCLSGFAACLSGCCYAELSGRIPLAGSAYAYAYVGMGEVFAFIAAACLSLEYICAAAAVSRSWGDKMVEYLGETLPNSHWIHAWLVPGGESGVTYNPLAFVIAAAVVGLLLCGVKESKRVANFFTMFKVALVVFMVGVALCYTKPSNWIPFAPYGVSGVIRGATGTFFGYLGYDQVCCLAGEAKDAKRNLPRAILGVLGGCATLYVLATLALTGMLPYDQISPISGFPDGFRTLGATTAAQITALGEIVTLPIVILVTIMAQPRLQYAMAVDGLLPPLFEDMDTMGTCIAGGVMCLVATLVPFENLNDMISCAVLCALSLTDTSVVLLWHEPAHDPESPLACHLMMAFHGAALVGSLALTHISATNWGVVLIFLSVSTMIFSCWRVYRDCPRATIFGGRRKHYHEDDLVREKGYFQTPFVPFLPCLAIAINWYLIAQLELLGVCLLLAFLLVAVFYYFFYAQFYSVGNTLGWCTEEIELAVESKDFSTEATNLII